MRAKIRSSIVALLALALCVSMISAGLSTQAIAQPESIADVQPANESPESVTDGSWSTGRADDGRTGATTADGPEPHGDVRWEDSVPGNPTGAPTVVDDTAYLAVQTERDTGRQIGAVAAYDTATGSAKWDRTGLGHPSGSPTVADGTVYVSTAAAVPTDLGEWYQEADGDGGLYALDAETGETQWVRNDSEKWRGAPVHAHGLIYAVRQSETSGDESWLVALDPETGETVWSVEADQIVGVVNGTAYGTAGDELFATDASSGEREWSVRASVDGGVEHAAVTDEAIYAVGERADETIQAYAYATADGSSLWNVSVGNSSTGPYPPAVADDSVFVTAGGDDELVRLDESTGTAEWRFELAQGELTGGPTVANDTVYVGGSAIKESNEPGEGYRSPNPAVFAIDARTGAYQWGYVVDDGVDSTDQVLAPSVVDGDLYVSSSGDIRNPWPQERAGQLHAFESSSTEPGVENTPSDGYFEEDADVEAKIAITEDDPDETFGTDKTVVLDGSPSSARYASITAYEWDVDDDGTFERSGEEISLPLEPCESATVTLRVTTDDGNTATESVVLSNG